MTTRPNTPKIDFSTHEYEFSHGKAPRGYGSWAFDFGNGEVVFAPTSTYGDAKVWARREAPVRFPGVPAFLITVLP